MFTGLIEATGEISRVDAHGEDRRFWVHAPGGFLDGVAVGDSIAVSGVCLTAVAFDDTAFAADVSVETLDATTARDWTAARRVNLEKALTLAKPLGGHLVTGHVDGVGHLETMAEDARSWRLRFSLPESLARYVAHKGSVCIDGISLTVNEVDGANFGVNIIPHTWERTSLSTLSPGAAVNIEVDLMARYAERLFADREPA